MVIVMMYCMLTYSYVWVLEGDTGKVLKGWPVKLPSEVQATVLLTKLVPGESSAADIVSSYSCAIIKDNQKPSPSKVRACVLWKLSNGTSISLKLTD